MDLIPELQKIVQEFKYIKDDNKNKQLAKNCKISCWYGIHDAINKGATNYWKALCACGDDTDIDVFNFIVEMWNLNGDGKFPRSGLYEGSILSNSRI